MDVNNEIIYSFFSKSHVTLPKWVHVIYLLANKTPIKNAIEQTGLSRTVVVDIFNFLREVCSTALLQTPIVLGGQGTIVQIDESLFNHKAKYHRGRHPQQETWVFGLADTSTTPATSFLQIVERRDAATLLPIIRDHVRPGTIVHSDQWSAYSRVGDLQTVGSHDWVNHTHHFDPVTGVHTQHVESLWNRVKTKFKAMKGVKRDMLPGYLDEFMWKERHRRNPFQDILREIAVQYPV